MAAARIYMPVPIEHNVYDMLLRYIHLEIFILPLHLYLFLTTHFTRLQEYPQSSEKLTPYYNTFFFSFL